jgi:hypothetical protein
MAWDFSGGIRRTISGGIISWPFSVYREKIEKCSDVRRGGIFTGFAAIESSTS